ncbi:hypothetical protein [Nocardiopsis halotolerans]|uniref:hypothetical protein n=1 Tax=Nocardiopsis halotolerans TaxID=124252 RepID=UPI00037B8975
MLLSMQNTVSRTKVALAALRGHGDVGDQARNGHSTQHSRSMPTLTTNAVSTIGSPLGKVTRPLRSISE